MENNQLSINQGYILAISFISAMGGYLFGFDFAVISGALPFLKEQFALNPNFAVANYLSSCLKFVHEYAT